MRIPCVGLRRSAFARASTIVVILAASATQAANGVVEINQTCATESGCFSGDAAGFPVTIDGSAGYSYALTTDLVVPNSSTTGVLFATNDLSLDLRGFSILRAGCEGAVTSCIPTAGLGSGVARTSATQLGQSVANGSVVGFGSTGVFLGRQARVDKVDARWNRVAGIRVEAGSVVTRSTATANGTVGFDLGPGSVLAESTSDENGGDGVAVDAGSVVTDHSSRSNGSDGIRTGDAGVVLGSLVIENGDHGIVTGAGSVVGHALVSASTLDGINVGAGSVVAGNTARQNGDDGISASFGSTLRQNTVYLNTGLGLSLESSANFHENVIRSNAGGSVGSGVNMGLNVCDGNTTCP